MLSERFEFWHEPDFDRPVKSWRGVGGRVRTRHFDTELDSNRLTGRERITKPQDFQRFVRSVKNTLNALRANGLRRLTLGELT